MQLQTILNRLERHKSTQRLCFFQPATFQAGVLPHFSGEQTTKPFPATPSTI